MASRQIILAVSVSLLLPGNGGAFVLSPTVRQAHLSSAHDQSRRLSPLFLADSDPPEEEKKNKVLDFMLNPYESTIPKEMEEEIYRAEGNTQAAKDRTQRVIAYGLAAVALVGCAFFNAFLTELRHGPAMEENPGMTLADMGFGWVTASGIFSFLFLNKLGGGLALVSGAVSGMMAEAELDSRRKNAERIWEELERRRNAGASTTKTRKKNKVKNPSKKKQKPSGKQAKRMGALSEVVAEDKQPQQVEPTVDEQAKEKATEQEKAKEEGGILGKLKGFYYKADSMAASQALLLNKELEDKGVLTKITDESGLKVIGKEAAEQLKEEEKSDTADKK